MSHACHRFWTCHKTLTCCSLLTRCTIPCVCHAKRHLVRACGVFHCFSHFDFEVCFAPHRRALCRHLNFQKCSEPSVFYTFWLRHVLRATTACTFFDVATSKSARKLRRFVHFDFEMCFAPQRCVLFRHFNFQKWSGPGVFCTFWLRHVLRAATACTFSSLIWPAGSAPTALASLLFDRPGPQTVGKTQCFATFPTFSRTWIFFLLRLSLFWSWFFFSSDSSPPLLSCVHIVGSLTSKFPSHSIW